MPVRERDQQLQKQAANAQIAATQQQQPVAGMQQQQRPQLNTNLGSDLGITFDEDAIRSRFDDATRAEFDHRRAEHGATEDRFGAQLHGMQGTLLDSMRRDRSQAISTGASKGMQAAQELSAVLGLGQEGVAGATGLAQDRALLADEEGAAYAGNIRDAMSESNRLRGEMGALGVQDRASDVQFDIGRMDADARRHAADQDLAGVDLSSLRQHDAQLGSAQIGADAAVQVEGMRGMSQENIAMIQGTFGNEQAQISAQAARDVAESQGQAQRDVANTHLEGVIQTALANIQIGESRNAAEKEMNQVRVDSNEAIAKMQDDTNRYISDNNLEGTKFAETLRASSNERIAEMNNEAAKELAHISGKYNVQAASAGRTVTGGSGGSDALGFSESLDKAAAEGDEKTYYSTLKGYGWSDEAIQQQWLKDTGKLGSRTSLRDSGSGGSFTGGTKLEDLLISSGGSGGGGSSFR